jgi:hypothetical protein
MEKKVLYDVRLSKPVMVVSTMAGIGLLPIGAKPFIGSTAAFVQTGWVQKIAICEEDGKKCMALSGGRA